MMHRRANLRTFAPHIAAAMVALAASSAFAQLGGGEGSGLLKDRRPGLPNVTPEPLKGVELRDKLGSTIPLDLAFTTSDGSPVTLAQLFGKPIITDGKPDTSGAKRPVVLMMMYFRCPMLCPMVMDSMVRQMRELDFTAGREFDAVIVSFDERDTIKDSSGIKDAALVSYGRMPTAPYTPAEKALADDLTKGMTFLTGPAATSKKLAESMGFSYRYLPESGEFAHGAAIFILTPEGKVSRYVTNLASSSTDLRLALVDASSGAIGSWTDQLMLRCLHFNPAEGGYSMSIMRGVQIAALLGVGALGGMIGMYLFVERRRRAAGRGAGSFRTGVVSSSETMSAQVSSRAGSLQTPGALVSGQP
jgi:protein SCO1